MTRDPLKMPIKSLQGFALHPWRFTYLRQDKPNSWWVLQKRQRISMDDFSLLFPRAWESTG
jgi:hypothetical protein